MIRFSFEHLILIKCNDESLATTWLELFQFFIKKKGDIHILFYKMKQFENP
jgi:hypothetical protein